METVVFVTPKKYNRDILIEPMYKRISLDYPVLVRDAVAAKLGRIAKRLPEDLSLQVDDGYRAHYIQEILWNNRYKENRKNNPLLTKEELHKLTRSLVFNPKEGVPPHSTGGAVDISLVDEKGNEINLSDPFEHYYEEAGLMSNKISKKAQNLRLLLHEAMLSEGFAPLPGEYWHFSHGDRVWGEFYNKKPLFTVEILPDAYYFPLYRRVFNRILHRLWKTFN